jgi:hypothetical protein
MPNDQKSTKISEKEFAPCPLSPDEIVYNPIDNDESQLNTKQTDRFRIIITFPSCLKSLTNQDTFSDSDRIIFSAYSVSSPKITVPDIPVQYLGKTLKLSSKEREPYENIEVNYKVDSGMKSYAILYNWINFIADQESATYGGRSGELKEYAALIEIQILDEFRNDVVIASWIYKDAFITDLSPIEFSFLTNDEIQGTFTFAFTEVLFGLSKYQG